MKAEGNGDPAVSPKGAMGLMQIMPATWAGLRDRYRLGADPCDLRDNIIAGAAYIRELYDRRYGSPGWIAAYNAGPGRYEDWLKGRPLPAETRAYVATVAPSSAMAMRIAPILVAAADPLAWTRAAVRRTVGARQPLVLCRPNAPPMTLTRRRACAMFPPSRRSPAVVLFVARRIRDGSHEARNPVRPREVSVVRGMGLATVSSREWGNREGGRARLSGRHPWVRWGASLVCTVWGGTIPAGRVPRILRAFSRRFARGTLPKIGSFGRIADL